MLNHNILKSLDLLDTINSKLKVVLGIAGCKITFHKCLLTFRFRVDVSEGESSQDYNGEIPIRIHLNLMSHLLYVIVF